MLGAFCLGGFLFVLLFVFFFLSKGSVCLLIVIFNCILFSHPCWPGWRIKMYVALEDCCFHASASFCVKNSAVGRTVISY